MRSVALIAAFVCAATAAHADGSRESRYGPAPDRAPVPRDDRGYAGVTYNGQMLGWNGKREVVAPPVQEQPAQQPWWSQGAPQVAQPAPQPAPRYAPQAQYQPQPQYQPQIPAAPQYQPAQPQPQQRAYAPAPRVAPVQTAYAEQTQPQAPAALPRWQPGQVGARTYSVGRQFGMEPDPIPAAGPSRMVLIAAPPAAPEDEAKSREDGEWSANKDGAK